MLQACGVEKFHVPVERVAVARLKDCPEDFIVAEVDPAGEATDAQTYKLPIPRTPTNSCGEVGSVQTVLSTATELNRGQCGGSAGDSEKHINVAVPMDDSLNESLLETLLEVFGSKREAVAQYSSCAAAGNLLFPTKEHDIGVFNERAEREQLHRAMKVLVPHLRSETRRHREATAGPVNIALDGDSAHACRDDDGGAIDYHIIVSYDCDFLLLSHLLGESVADALVAWNASVPQGPPLHLTAKFPMTASKEVRRSFHEVMSKRYPRITCRVSNGQVVIRGSSSGFGKRQRVDGNRETVGFTHLLIRKRNLDIMELRMLLAEHFCVPIDAVCTAGMKDKCAVTYQRCSVPCTRQPRDPREEESGIDGDVPLRLTWTDDLSSYVEILQTSGPHSTPVGIGELKGNMFHIRLRDVRGITPSELMQRSCRLEKEGFLNYFGQQRFSEHAECFMDHIGVHILGGRWPEAVRCLLRGAPELYDLFPTHMEPRYVPARLRDARCIVQALNRLHRTRYTTLTRADVTECTQLWRDVCRDALQAVPYAFRVLWLCGAQSLIFNRLLSMLHGPQLPVTLPLLGYNVSVEGGVRSAVDKVLMELNLGTVDEFAQRKKVLGVGMPGALRATVVRPVGCSVSFTTVEGGSSDVFDATLSFFLPSSSYATIFLREVLGCDTWW
ncbi:hypothetical protein, conserved [Trypanosoma brucei gambiense DAL972]|uniref:TRUD domain-containing protein n=1 Tax=Trypanosoma brucei gambiense (strain MHOM/CI/86/DAL972) TaxID=679716 RepID=D0AAQ9_TRYB9|nr:hypothetical protein, conserved [Trypanosoma brucei gambiense DAL972]CBH18760.1 hypothetical protein, conserved [Trypanosoma brucei gambiense DAL972]|eukprot:XP_011781024.1 hypothetical protein, conserved [Trypanosoma brucei gambiense DAL972]